MDTRIKIHRVTLREFKRALTAPTPTIPITVHLTSRQYARLNKIATHYGLTPTTIVLDMMLDYTKE